MKVSSHVDERLSPTRCVPLHDAMAAHIWADGLIQSGVVELKRVTAEAAGSSRAPAFGTNLAIRATRELAQSSGGPGRRHLTNFAGWRKA